MMTHPTARMVLALLLGSGLCQCALLKKKETPEEPKEETKTLLVGTVELVNPEQQYVLILRDKSMILAPGTELVCLDATGAVSKIVTTPEQKGNFIAADIKEGLPKVKNLVLHVTHPGANPAASITPLSGVASLPAGLSSVPPMDGPLDSGLPPLDLDPTIESGSIPEGGISLDLPAEAPPPSDPPLIQE